MLLADSTSEGGERGGDEAGGGSVMPLYFPDGRPEEAKECSLLDPPYWIHEECEKFPAHSEEEVIAWADCFYDWGAEQARGILVFGKSFRHLDPTIQWILRVTDSHQVSGEEALKLGVNFCAIVGGNDWASLRTLSKMLEKRDRYENRILEEMGMADGPAVMLKRFFSFRRAGRLPLKKELLETVRKTVAVEETTFSKWLKKYGLQGLPEATRGPKRK
ncbi:MAG: hypothetical protein P1U58_18720, partial [Verrucomicrobiales bacterium]|nr:hypothetical protein [Verrucomicrobiales bacterium]